MIPVGDRRDGWVGLSSCPQTISSEPKVGQRKPPTRAKWRSSTSACSGVLGKCLTPPTLLDMGIVTPVNSRAEMETLSVSPHDLTMRIK